MSLLKTLFGFDATASLQRAEKYEKIGKLGMAKLELEEALSNLSPGERVLREEINAALDRVIQQEKQNAVVQAESALAAGDTGQARYFYQVALASQEEGAPEYQTLKEKLEALPEGEEEAKIEDELDSILRAEVGINFLDRQRKLEFWKSGFPPYKEEYYFDKVLTSDVVQAQIRKVEETPEDPDVRFNLGLTLAQLGLVKKAMEQVRAFLTIRPDDRDGHYFLANLLADDGQEAEALRSFEKVISLDPEFVEAYFYMAQVYFRLGDTTRATQLCREIISRNPDSEFAEEARTLVKE
jgi:tetratricopeptide (TPR) repeat protein